MAERGTTGKGGTIPATEARQETTGQGVRYVLGISLMLVIFAFVLACPYA